MPSRCSHIKRSAKPAAKARAVTSAARDWLLSNLLSWDRRSAPVFFCSEYYLEDGAIGRNNAAGLPTIACAHPGRQSGKATGLLTAALPDTIRTSRQFMTRIHKAILPVEPAE